MTKIRAATAADAELLSRLGAATFTASFGHLYCAENLRRFLEKSHAIGVYRDLFSDENCGIWIAENEAGEAVGYAVAGPCSLPVPDMPQSAGELARLYLVKHAQGAGLGAAMLKIAMDFLKARFEHVYLSVYAENFPAQKLYQRHGFKKLCDYFYMVGDHADPEWIMVLEER